MDATDLIQLDGSTWRYRSWLIGLNSAGVMLTAEDTLTRQVFDVMTVGRRTLDALTEVVARIDAEEMKC